jgi:DNA-directed RNA polymerase specialized sigma24 family protein
MAKTDEALAVEDRNLGHREDRRRSRRLRADQAPAPEQTIGLITPDDFRLLSATLERFARRFRLSPEDAEDIVGEVLAESVGAGEKVRQPGAYLFWTTRNRVVDHLRRARLHPLEPLNNEELERGSGQHYSELDDTVARLLERRATAEIIETALRAAAAAEDWVVVRVVSVWLELAEELGREPTSREVAPEADTSHTTVNNALRRLAAYLPPEA